MSYILLAITGVHALFILYPTLKSRDPNHRPVQLISAILLLGALGGVFILPQYSGYLVGLGWFLFLLLPSYFDMEMRIAFRKEDWAKAAVLANRTSRLLPSARLRDSAVMYHILDQLSRQQYGPALATLDSVQAQTPALKEWFDWQTAILRNDLSRVEAETSQPDTHLAPPDTLAIHLLSLALQNKLADLLNTLQEKESLIAQQHPQTRQTNNLYLFALNGRPDLVQQIIAQQQTSGSPANWLFWLAIAQFNAGDSQTAEQTFQQAAQSGDETYRKYIQQQHQQLQSASRQELTAEQQAWIAAYIAAWEAAEAAN